MIQKQWKTEDVAAQFVTFAIQEWQQSDQERRDAVQAVLVAAGFDAQATCAPVFGAIWHTPCTGKDGEAATDWLTNLTKTMPRGHYEIEAAHVATAIMNRLDSLNGNT